MQLHAGIRMKEGRCESVQRGQVSVPGRSKHECSAPSWSMRSCSRASTVDGVFCCGHLGGGCAGGGWVGVTGGGRRDGAEKGGMLYQPASQKAAGSQRSGAQSAYSQPQALVCGVVRSSGVVIPSALPAPIRPHDCPLTPRPRSLWPLAPCRPPVSAETNSNRLNPPSCPLHLAPCCGRSLTTSWRGKVVLDGGITALIPEPHAHTQALLAPSGASSSSGAAPPFLLKVRHKGRPCQALAPGRGGVGWGAGGRRTGPAWRRRWRGGGGGGVRVGFSRLAGLQQGLEGGAVAGWWRSRGRGGLGGPLPLGGQSARSTLACGITPLASTHYTTKPPSHLCFSRRPGLPPPHTHTPAARCASCSLCVCVQVCAFPPSYTALLPVLNRKQVLAGLQQGIWPGCSAPTAAWPYSLKQVGAPCPCLWGGLGLEVGWVVGGGWVGERRRGQQLRCTSHVPHVHVHVHVWYMP